MQSLAVWVTGGTWLTRSNKTRTEIGFCCMQKPTKHTFNGPLSGTTQVSRYQKGKTNLDFTEATDSEWQWHQLGHMQVCTSLQTDNHASTPPLNFLQAGCPSCRPTNSVKALTAKANYCSVKVIVSTFRCSAPAVSLPKTVLSSDSVAVFKSRLKCSAYLICIHADTYIGTTLRCFNFYRLQKINNTCKNQTRKLTKERS